jgi:fibronectin type 3 domain-containing protein
MGILQTIYNKILIWRLVLKTLIKISLISYLILSFSGCTPGNLGTPSKPKIDENLPSVDAQSIKTISDITAIALEWQGVQDNKIQGYHIYRSNLQEESQKLLRVKTLDTRYTSHYTDEDLQPNSKYLYAISTVGPNGTESIASQTVMAQTLPTFEGVSFIAAVSDLPRQIKIVWRPHTNLGVNSYEVQKSSLTDTKWKNEKTIKGRLNAEYIDTGLKDNQEFKYRVIAKRFDGLESQPSSIVQAKTKPLPSGITNFVATKDLPRKIELTWEPSKSEDVKYYKIYRGLFSDSLFKEIAQVASTNNLFTDIVNEDGKVHYYKITAIDKDGLESSKDISPIMGSTLSKPAKPIITLALIEGNKAILNWTAGDDRTVSYNIIKKIKEGTFSSSETLIPNIQDVRFEDEDVVRGVEYSYSLQAIDANGIASEKTSATQIVLPKLDPVEAK